MNKIMYSFYDYECRLFKEVNRHFDKRLLNFFFRWITHVGGASFMVATTLVVIFLSSNQTRIAAMSSALALAVSHIPVQLAKKLYPRKRPYLILEKTRFPANPLKDHSFPSGHTTAIFSVIMPLGLLAPHLFVFLIPLGLSVGLSRIYLGLHYPSDVLAGAVLGIGTGTICYYLVM
ncbi:phosphatase PAP2 family protein [Neobacillus sp. LXY-4]|uniref:phosphatase PAP2 family protein n=1 Tax=Neobacillus sp. LXY-4 TaxID=3379826 RepID=UPI003EE38CEF